VKALLRQIRQLVAHWVAVWEFRHAWVKKLGAQWPAAPIDIPDWSQADGEALRRFFATEPGQKMQRLIRQMESDFNASAVLKAAPVACGYAAGFRACYAYVITLSAHIPPHTDEDANDAHNAGGAALRERLSP
jgi:hypothetical protein